MYYMFVTEVILGGGVVLECIILSSVIIIWIPICYF